MAKVSKNIKIFFHISQNLKNLSKGSHRCISEQRPFSKVLIYIHYFHKNSHCKTLLKVIQINLNVSDKVFCFNKDQED